MRRTRGCILASVTLRTQDNFELAEREYREAIRRAEKEPRAHYLLAKALLEQKRAEEALKEASTALSIEERTPSTWCKRRAFSTG